MAAGNTPRKDGRGFADLREIRIHPGAAAYAEGSAEVSFGNTRVLVAASVEKEIPKWMEAGAALPRGWITAEYGMLPRSTHTRNKREAALGKQSGRTLEIQRLIGRALRASIDLSQIPGVTIKVDCDVLCADGGTRTAAISGAWVALAQSLRWCLNAGLVTSAVPIQQIAAVSAGVVGGTPMLDLCYEEDSSADFDLNVVLDQQLRLIEIQGTAERTPMSAGTFQELLSLAESGIKHIMNLQSQAIL